MYEQFGFSQSTGGKQSLSLFIPDATIDKVELFMVVLNFSDATQYVDIPLSTNGQWTDLLNGNTIVTVQNYHLNNYPVSSNWGCILWQ